MEHYQQEPKTHMRELFFVHCSRAKEVLLSACSLCERVVPDVLPRSAEHTCIVVQGLEENLRETQATAQRLETHLKQKEKLYEDKIKVEFQNT